jgi:hypothetical protein
MDYSRIKIQAVTGQEDSYVKTTDIKYSKKQLMKSNYRVISRLRVAQPMGSQSVDSSLGCLCRIGSGQLIVLKHGG